MATTLRETARGFASAQTATSALTNTTTETTMYSQAIKAGSMGTNKEMNFKFICLLTTGLAAPTLTIKVKLGTSVLTVGAAMALALSMTAVPFIVEGSIINEDSAASQLSWCKITQHSNTLALLISGSNALVATTWTEDTTVDKTFVITAQFGSAIVGTSLTFRHASIDLT